MPDFFSNFYTKPKLSIKITIFAENGTLSIINTTFFAVGKPVKKRLLFHNYTIFSHFSYDFGRNISIFNY